MKIDPVRHIGAVRREVAARDHEGRPAHAVVASRTYDTTVEDLWDAITSPERIPRWFLPVSGDLRPGGRYQLEGNAGGRIDRCDPPHLLAVTWEYGGQVSWLEVRLAGDPAGGASLRLEHVAPVDEHWERFGPGAAGVGWDMALAGLDRHLSDGAAVDPAEAAAWMASDQGKDFVRSSSEAWGRASIESGADAAEARAASERTTAAYTGAPVASEGPGDSAGRAPGGSGGYASDPGGGD
ncbi:MAG TPA: SRPBCC family protein [Longimicrobiales bacterium]|nr:SRPBCC family protein [Longimicrobiales bacterium]